MRIENRTSGTTVALRTEVAGTFLRRVVGLIGRSGIREGDALLIVPCQAIHTLFMRFPVDILFLDRSMRVVRVLENLPPFTVGRVCARASCALELRAGSVRRGSVRVGDQLACCDGPDPFSR